MFYINQPIDQKNDYKDMLAIIGSLSKLFSESTCPYLHYRIHENIFSKYFEAENISREDCSADAKKNNVGIGLKTWVGADAQKIAEFGKLRPQYENLDGLELVKKISEYRNERIRITKQLHGINEMIYHIIKRIPNKMQILECDFTPIDISKIQILKTTENNIYFTDKKHGYHFSKSKNTLYMTFDRMTLCDEIDVKILDDPYDALKKYAISNLASNNNIATNKNSNTLCLRLYSIKNGVKYIPEKSGLNQWNGCRRTYKEDGTYLESQRNEDELYIPFPSEDRKNNPDFFPPRDTPFNLHLPDGTIISAKVCQDDGKAIMSNPNKDLGNWLLRKVFELKPGTLVTYEMLQIFNIDSVMFTKLDANNYSIDFCELDTYEKVNDIEPLDDTDDNE